MIRKHFFLFFLSLPFAIAAQNTVTVRCNFASAGNDSSTIKPAVYFIDEYDKSYRLIMKGGQGEAKFQIDKPTVAQLYYRNQTVPLFVEPGDELECTIGSDSLYNSISFKGKGSANNEFLTAFYKNFRNDFDKKSVTSAILSNDLDAFEMSLYEGRKKQLDFFSNYKDKGPLSESFRKYMEYTIRYHYFATLLSYPIIQANQSAQILTVKALPPVMLEGITTKLVNDDALVSEAYRDFLYYYAVYFTSEANGFNKFKDMSLSMESKVVTATKSFTPQSRIWYIASFLNSEVERVSPYTAKHVYEVLTTEENNGTYTHLLAPKVKARLAMKENEATASVEKTSNAAASSKSDYPKLKGIDGKYFTFDDLKGKVVYVDYWASWCGPCRNEMPYSKQLHSMFTSQQLKDIVFLYISIDGSEDAWKAAVNQLGIEGKLAISPGNWQSEIAKFFQISSIPRYMLIDTKGNIVDLNAKRPSSGQQIYNDIIHLLN
jgi:thiol-disulfide isomerase/thioredoxin